MSVTLYSLAMDVELVDGVWIIAAPWLDAPVTGPTFEAAYALAMRARRVT